MVEAGADEVPEDVLLEALDLAHAEIRKLCEAQEDLRRQAGKVKWLDTELTAELESSHGHTIWERLQEKGLREGAAITEELEDELAPELSMDSTEEDIDRRMQVRASLALAPREAAARRGRGAGARAVRRGPPRAHRGGAGLEGAEVRQAAPALRPDRRDRGAAVPGRPGDGRRRGPGGQGLGHEELRQEGRRGDLQGPRPQEDRDREAAPGRARHRGDPADRVRGDGQPAHARLGALHARPDADHDALHARHRQGGAADRRPLARDRPPLHAPLQLPALLGRGDGLHARPEAARHRPRGARAAGARGDDPAGRRSSRTRSGSSRRRSSRTARRRWARCAARRSR